MWKKVDAAFAIKDFVTAIEWCRLAQCSIFENAGDTNKAKIQRWVIYKFIVDRYVTQSQKLMNYRKLILCGLGSSNTKLSRDAFAGLPIESRNDPLTSFLMYKVALKDRDLDLGM